MHTWGLHQNSPRITSHHPESPSATFLSPPSILRSPNLTQSHPTPHANPSAPKHTTQTHPKINPHLSSPQTAYELTLSPIVTLTQVIPNHTQGHPRAPKKTQTDPKSTVGNPLCLKPTHPSSPLITCGHPGSPTLNPHSIFQNLRFIKLDMSHPKSPKQNQPYQGYPKVTHIHPHLPIRLHHFVVCRIV